MGEYRIAEALPCEWTARVHPPCLDERPLLDTCRGCAGDGTRWVITDRRIEPAGDRRDVSMWREVRDDG